MREISAAVVLIMVLFISSISSASGSFGTSRSLRCGTRLASVGDSKFEVLNKCGSPTSVYSWEEDRVERVTGFPYSGNSYYFGTRIPLYTIVHVIIEEWIYNLGTNRFMRILTFENNRLVRIDVGDYGY